MAWPIDIVFDRVLLFHNDRWVTLSLNLVNDRPENSRRPTRFPFGQLPLKEVLILTELCKRTNPLLTYELKQNIYGLDVTPTFPVSHWQ